MGKSPSFLCSFLFAQTQFSQDSTITLDVLLFEVVEQAAALTNHLEQTTTGVVILLVELEVLVEVVDALGQQSDLNLGGTGVALVAFELFDDF